MKASLIVVQSLDSGKFLMMAGPKGLGFPCGKWEEGESGMQAALRELEEETGLTDVDGPYWLCDMPHGEFTVSCYDATLPIEMHAEPESAHEGHCVWMSKEEILAADSKYADFNRELLSKLDALREG